MREVSIDMTDNELRGRLLKWYYEKRREGGVRPTPKDFDEIIDDLDITRVSRQLYEHNLIVASYTPPGRDSSPFGNLHQARISADGIDVIEGEAKAPIAVRIDNRRIENKQTFNIDRSTGIQVGDYNSQEVVGALEQIVSRINGIDASEAERKEAKSRLESFLKHPLVNTVLGETLSHLPKTAALVKLLEG